jgi:hypothetical protein
MTSLRSHTPRYRTLKAFQSVSYLGAAGEVLHLFDNFPEIPSTADSVVKLGGALVYIILGGELGAQATYSYRPPQQVEQSK